MGTITERLWLKLLMRIKMLLEMSDMVLTRSTRGSRTTTRIASISTEWAEVKCQPRTNTTMMASPKTKKMQRCSYRGQTSTTSTRTT